MPFVFFKLSKCLLFLKSWTFLYSQFPQWYDLTTFWIIFFFSLQKFEHISFLYNFLASYWCFLSHTWFCWVLQIPFFFLGLKQFFFSIPNQKENSLQLDRMQLFRKLSYVTKLSKMPVLGQTKYYLLWPCKDYLYFNLKWYSLWFMHFNNYFNTYLIKRLVYLILMVWQEHLDKSWERRRDESKNGPFIVFGCILLHSINKINL